MSESKKRVKYYIYIPFSPDTSKEEACRIAKDIGKSFGFAVNVVAIPEDVYLSKIWELVQ